MALTPTEEAQTRLLIAQEAQLLSLAGNEPTIISKLGATKVSLSDLTAAGSITDTDLFLVRQGVTDKKATAATMGAYFPSAAKIQQAAFSSAVAGGTSDAITAAFTPTITSLPTAPNMLSVLVRAGTANATTTPTFKADGTAAKTIVKLNNQPLSAGDISGSGHWMHLDYDATLDKWVLINPSGGNQVSGIVGSSRNVAMAVTALSASATLTADEIIVETALGGNRYCLPSFSKVINLATTGAGGMDTGSAPATGFVAIYAIYNPTTGVSALLATNATAVTPGNIYGGANMPAGFTASALVSVWRTNGAQQFFFGAQYDRTVYTPASTALNSTTNQASFTSLGISAVAPRNARSISGSFSVGSNATVSQTTSMTVATDANGVSAQTVTLSGTSASGAQSSVPFANLSVTALQAIFYTATTNTGTATYTINVSSYTF